MAKCEVCDGKGTDPAGEHYEGSASHLCPVCRGTGQVEEIEQPFDHDGMDGFAFGDPGDLDDGQPDELTEMEDFA